MPAAKSRNRLPSTSQTSTPRPCDITNGCSRGYDGDTTSASRARTARALGPGNSVRMAGELSESLFILLLAPARAMDAKISWIDAHRRRGRFRFAGTGREERAARPQSAAQQHRERLQLRVARLLLRGPGRP